MFIAVADTTTASGKPYFLSLGNGSTTAESDTSIVMLRNESGSNNLTLLSQATGNVTAPSISSPPTGITRLFSGWRNSNTLNSTDNGNTSGGSCNLASPVNLNISTYRVGGDFGATATFTGRICEVLVYNTVLSNDQRLRVENYLSAKWGILPRPALWLDGADPYGNGTPPADGTVISTWTDKSGNAYNGTGVNSPTYTASGILFNGSQYYTTPYTSASPSESIFVVFTMTSFPGPGLLVSTDSIAGRSYGITLYLGNANFAIGRHYQYETYNTTQVIGTNTRYLGEVTYSTSGTNFYVSGAIGDSTSCNISVTSGLTTIGAGYGNPTSYGYFFNGTINEVLIFSNALSTQQRYMVETYLMNKWTISGTSNVYSSTAISPQAVASNPTITQPDTNLGYLVTGQGNAGTSTLHYDGRNWSLN
jgi:hypothetical protein